ncbi:MAG: serine/threonine-protein phosphatase [Eubacteriales bacterium]|nr:serine/threonine-protein phosphatase [Eubacteriales bacterium]
MKYIIGAETDIGTSKDTNQDSLMCRVADTDYGQVALVVLCDGMGGLAKGELASANVVRAFSEWFKNVLPTMMTDQFTPSVVHNSWDNLVQYQNELLFQYGKNNYTQLGTTLVAALIYNGQYYAVNVGDSRMYKLTSSAIEKVTEDQSLVSKEVAQGKLTEEEAEHDSRRNILLQCIGATAKVSPDYYEGNLALGEALMLCCDGFRHEITKQEMFDELKPDLYNNKNEIHDRIAHLIKVNMQRKETDNITALVIKAV